MEKEMHNASDLFILDTLKSRKFSDRENAYSELKERFPNHLILFSETYMHAVINEDAEKLHKTFKYQIMKTGKVRFPKKTAFEKVRSKFSVIVIGPNFRVTSIYTHEQKVEDGDDVLFLNNYDKRDIEDTYFLEDKGYLLSTKSIYLKTNNCVKCFEKGTKQCLQLMCPLEAIKFFKNILEVKYPNLTQLNSCCVVVVPNSKGEQNMALTMFAKSTFVNSTILTNMFGNLILENNNQNGASKVDRIKRKDEIIRYKINEYDHYEMLKFENIIIIDDVATTDSTLDAFELLIRLNVGASTCIYKLALSKTLFH